MIELFEDRSLTIPQKSPSKIDRDLIAMLCSFQHKKMRHQIKDAMKNCNIRFEGFYDCDAQSKPAAESETPTWPQNPLLLP